MPGHRAQGSETERPRTQSSMTPNELAGRAARAEFAERQRVEREMQSRKAFGLEPDPDPDPEEPAA